jgi:signal transduction histidine kinase
VRFRSTRIATLAALCLGCLSGRAASEAQVSAVVSTEILQATNSSRVVTNVAQIRTLSGFDFLAGRGFQLTGVITLVDTNRNLIVLQDDTGAVALHTRLQVQLAAGQLVSLSASNCSPSQERFPEYPYYPSGWDVRPSFEAPMGWGNYYLTRMRGFLHPPVSGEYVFWIASDNSSELWVSQDSDPAKIKRISFIPRFGWVAPHEWSKLPSQRSEPIWLNAGQRYYIEALQEQTSGADHLSVAWQGPTVGRSVVRSRYLTPWMQGKYASLSSTNGVLREYWTNYSSGTLNGMGGTRLFESSLSVEDLGVKVLGTAEMPKPYRIAFNQPWSVQNNFQWVEAEGIVTFAGELGATSFLELSDGRTQLQVRAAPGSSALSQVSRKLPIRVTGVCEGVFDQKGTLVPGLIWATLPEGISIVEAALTNATPAPEDEVLKATPIQTNPSMEGFYGTHGVVTFNDRVFDKDCLFVQEGSFAIFVSLENRQFKNQIKVGQHVELGGTLQPGKFLPVISPLVFVEAGWRSMPVPITEPIQAPIPGDRDGRWYEIYGVVHRVNSNGTLSVMGSKGAVDVWLGGTESNQLSCYVDAKVRARGVLSLTTLDRPILLVPSRSFLDVEEESPRDPFEIPLRAVAEVIPDSDPASLHRVRLSGTVTFQTDTSFFIQDSSGGIRVQSSAEFPVKIGDAVEVIGFPTGDGPIRMLTEPQVRLARTVQQIKPIRLDLSEPFSIEQSDVLVEVSASVVGQKTIGRTQVLELQEQQRLFAATLPADQGGLPDIAPGSRIRLVGVCDIGALIPTAPKKITGERASAGSLNIWLRKASDVVVLAGPPWWTWKRAAALIGTLLTVLLVALLWVHLLRRRLERQQATQLAFSQQILERLEGERRRIAVNLHDSLGQVLLVIKNQALLGMQRTPDDPARQRLGEISGAASQALEEVRQITHGLRPYQLDRLGLTQAIRTAVSLASDNSSISFASKIESIDQMFDKDSEIHVYRIVQEAITNVIKHSGATEATVVVKNRGTAVSISIRDNGRGFDADSKRSPEALDLGYGLTGIAERVRILGGTVAIDSKPGEGTTVAVEISAPIPKHDARSNHTDRR